MVEYLHLLIDYGLLKNDGSKGVKGKKKEKKEN